MIQPISFAEEHIRELQKTSKRDPVLLERAVYAFGLLEALARVPSAKNRHNWLPLP